MLALKDGLEVHLNDKKIWGVQAPETVEKEGGKSGERSFFGVTAADIGCHGDSLPPFVVSVVVL